MRQKLNLVIGCKISAEATSESSGRGGSINCLILDEFAFIAPSCILGDGLITLKDTETGEIKQYTLEQAYKLLNK